MKDSLGDRIRTLRKNSGLRQIDIANKLHIDRASYANYENGSREPSHLMLCQMAALFDVSTDFLLGRSASTRPEAGGLDDRVFGQIMSAFSRMHEGERRELLDVLRTRFPRLFVD